MVIFYRIITIVEQPKTITIPTFRFIFLFFILIYTKHEDKPIRFQTV